MAILAGFALVRAGGDLSKYYIENWTGDMVEGQSSQPVGEGPLGAIQYQTGRVTYDTLATNVLQEAIVTLSSASFAELATTSLELIPVPPGGPGFINQVVDIIGFRVFSSESWNNKDNKPTVGYSGGKKIAITASLSNGLFSGGAADAAASPSYVVTNPAITYSAVSNSAVVLRRSGAAEPTIDGDTYFVFRILYRILSIP